MKRSWLRKSAAVSVCVALTLVQPLSLSAGPVEAAPEVAATRGPQATVVAPAIGLPIQPLTLAVAPSPIAAGPSALALPAPAVMGLPTPLRAPSAAILARTDVDSPAPAEAEAAESEAPATSGLNVPPESHQLSLAQGSLESLRRSAARVEDASESPALDEMYELSLPSGKNLRVWLPRKSEDKERGMKLRGRVPAQGMIEDVGADADLRHWSKNMLVAVDVVTLDSQGAVQDVRSNVSPSLPGTLWTRVGLQSLKGRYLLTLPAGEARRAGLTEGAAVSGLDAFPVKPRSDELARRVREDGETGLEFVLAHFRENQDDFVEFDSMVGLLKADPAAIRLLYERVLRKERFSFLYRGILASRAPALWLRMERAAELWDLPFRILDMPFTFFHEGGHYLAARLLGGKVDKFRVFPTGGGFVNYSGAETKWRSILVTATGPALEFAAGAALVAVAFFFDSAGEFWRVGAALTGYLRIMVVIPGAAGDIVDAASLLGLSRLSAEISFRTKQSRSVFGGFCGILMGLLFEAVGFKSDKSHSAPSSLAAVVPRATDSARSPKTNLR
jgi:uncharacterized membrane protein (UPF0127 family)